MSQRELKALLDDPYMQAAVNLTGTGHRWTHQLSHRKADNTNLTVVVCNGGVTAGTDSKLLRRVQCFENCLRAAEAEAATSEKVAELELACWQYHGAQEKVA